MEEAKTYTIRELTADDMFPMVAILDKVGLEKILDCFTAQEIVAAAAAGGNAERVGYDVFVKIAKIIVANAVAVKDDLYTLISQLSGLTRKEVAALPMPVFVKLIIEVVKQVNFKDFFTDVSK